MKKLVFTAMWVFLLLSLSGCNEKIDSVISEAKLTDREKELLTTVTDQYLVYDYKVDATYKKVSIWVEKYQSGKMVGEKTPVTVEVNESGTITYATAKTTEDQEITFITGIDGSSSVSSVIGNTLESSASIFGSNPEPVHPDDGELILGSLCFKKDEGELRSLSTEFYRDSATNIDELQNYDTVYLFKSEFTQ